MHFPTVIVGSLTLLSGLVTAQLTITRTVTIDPIEVTEPSKPTTKKTTSKAPTTIITFTKPPTTSSKTEVTKTVYITVTTSVRPPPTTTKKPSPIPPAVTDGPDPNSSKCPVPLYYGCYASRSANACTKCVQGAYCKSQNEYYWQCVTTAIEDDDRR